MVGASIVDSSIATSSPPPPRTLRRRDPWTGMLLCLELRFDGGVEENASTAVVSLKYEPA